MTDWKGIGWVCAWAVLAVVASWMLRSIGAPGDLAEEKVGASRQDGSMRVVSLSPAITETLFALEAGETLVGRTDHCLYPAAAKELPRIGPGLAPDLEGIVKRDPTLILADAGSGPGGEGLRRIAPIRMLPWLTLDDVIDSTKKLGEWLGRPREAADLAAKLQNGLKGKAPSDAPRTLLLLGAEPDAGTLWYVRANSLHGRALEAAGAQNAMLRDTDGPPELSLEGLMKVNPDIIIGLADGPALSQERRTAFERRFDVFPGLNAAKTGRVHVISRPGAMSTGPRILELVAELRAILSLGQGEGGR